MAESSTGSRAGPARRPHHPLPDTIHAAGAIPFLHPTKRYHPVKDTLKQLHPITKPPSPLPSTAAHQPKTATVALKETRLRGNEIYHIWRSRDNRKGRHRQVITGLGAKEYDTGRKSKLGKTAVGWSRLITRFPVGDVSYLVAVSFVIGSIIWCINGFFTWLPLAAPTTEFPHETDWAGILACVGASVFEVGSVLMVVEAIEAGGSDCSGWALEKTPDGGGVKLRSTTPGRRHLHRSGRRNLRKDSVMRATETPALGNVAESRSVEEAEAGDEETWIEPHRCHWFPPLSELKSHYLREIGFLASSVQLLAATIFWISGITALPPIFNSLSPGATDGVFWVPQVVGGTGFVLSALMFMIEVQDKWYKPAPRLLGWHVGLWNLIGGIGFTVCAGAGFVSADSAPVAYASALATFIGSWAFLIGSVLQWYESLDKHPVSVDKPPAWLSSSSSSDGEE
ncbi:hypothetical protein C8A05DRAFT_45288 [Staphylotrichum tortipilum]|uniref:Integral membrane protein n=1 Tax=Staphylotrichum tortipilum TaxID=2831512 RepID=A0AAN6RSB9_9PEZI|nr:hypothetical protein C8A05DRAFT_45288 [Staphylotrichum longicolle]